jgi:hypothetical protein
VARSANGCVDMSGQLDESSGRTQVAALAQEVQNGPCSALHDSWLPVNELHVTRSALAVAASVLMPLVLGAVCEEERSPPDTVATSIAKIERETRAGLVTSTSTRAGLVTSTSTPRRGTAERVSAPTVQDNRTWDQLTPSERSVWNRYFAARAQAEYEMRRQERQRQQSNSNSEATNVATRDRGRLENQRAEETRQAAHVEETRQAAQAEQRRAEQRRAEQRRQEELQRQRREEERRR